jgi:hypothetical protein
MLLKGDSLKQIAPQLISAFNKRPQHKTQKGRIRILVTLLDLQPMLAASAETEEERSQAMLLDSLHLYRLLEKDGCTLTRVFTLEWELESKTEVWLLDFQTWFAYVCLKQGPLSCCVIGALKPKKNREVCSAFFGDLIANDSRFGVTLFRALPSKVVNRLERLVPASVVRNSFRNWIENHYPGGWIALRDDLIGLLKATPDDRSPEIEGFKPLIDRLQAIGGGRESGVSSADKQSILDVYFSTY